MIDTVGGRKVAVAAVALVVGIGATLLRGDIPPNLLELIQVLFGAFIVGNGVEHVAGAIAEGKANAQPAEAPQVDLTPVQTALTELREQNQATLNTMGVIQEGLSTILTIAGAGPRKQ